LIRGRTLWQARSVLDKPSIDDAVLVDGVGTGWGVAVSGIDFLPIGLDGAAWAYRVDAAPGERYFLKVRRRRPAPASIRLPQILCEQGLHQAVAPIAPLDGQLWHETDGLHLLLYPFIDGASAWTPGFTDRQWHEHGTFLRRLHASTVPDDLLPTEKYTAEAARRALAGISVPTGADEIGRSLARLVEQHRAEIDEMATRTLVLAQRAKEANAPVVVCHTDIHPGNVIVGPDGGLSVVDWDAPMLAPPERDLMFVLSPGYGEQPFTPHRRDRFLAGYGPHPVNVEVLDYYVRERILDDATLFIASILDESAGDAARTNDLHWLGRLFPHP
jgi:spectinomycin phosphotransferase